MGCGFCLLVVHLSRPVFLGAGLRCFYERGEGLSGATEARNANGYPSGSTLPRVRVQAIPEATSESVVQNSGACMVCERSVCDADDACTSAHAVQCAWPVMSEQGRAGMER